MGRLKSSTGLVIWVSSLVLYGLFLFWHGAFNSAMNQAEVESYMTQLKKLNPKGGSPERLNMLRSFLEKDDGKAVYMFNAIKLYKEPRKVNGVRSGESSEQVLNRYSSYVMSHLIPRGGYPVLAGKSVFQSLELWGLEKGRDWSLGGVVRYPSRRHLVEMILNPTFQRLHKLKVASIEKTFAFPLRPIVLFGGAPLVVGLLLFSLASFLHLLLCIRRLKSMNSPSTS